MSQASNVLEEAIINHFFRGSAVSAKTAYVGLFNGNPGEAGTGGTEVTTTIRSAGRVAAGFGAPVDGVTTNEADIDFGTSEGAADFDHVGIFDAATSGNLLAYGEVEDSAGNPVTRSIQAGDGLKMLAGKLELTVA